MSSDCVIGSRILCIYNLKYLVFLISTAILIIAENSSQKRENKNTHNPTHTEANIFNSLIYFLLEYFPGICSVHTIL